MFTSRTYLRLGVMAILLAFVSCGMDGADGKDGMDGNANVQTFILNISEDTEFDVSLGLPLPELTQDVIDNDLVVGYVKFQNDPNSYAIPRGTISAYGHPEVFSITASLRPGHYDLLFRDADGNDFSIFSDQLESVKVVIIEATNTTSRTVTGNL